MANQVHRDESIDTLKGIAIILMVIGHAGCSKFLHDYIYLFHMPLFFFITGYMFKFEYIDAPLKFIKRRLLTCYVPFVKYGLLFLMAHELLVPLGFTQHYNLHNYFHQVLWIFSFSGTEGVFLGPYWFLIEMFFASILFVVSLWGCKKLTPSSHIQLSLKPILGGGNFDCNYLYNRVLHC